MGDYLQNKKINSIALVDDDVNIVSSVSMALKSEGFHVDTYQDGFKAFDGIQKNLPDLAVIDIKMPRMDGIELLQKLREKTDLPIIFLTSKDDEIDEMVGLRLGADDYIKKPFSQKLLIERIRALLRRSELNTYSNQTDVPEKVFKRGHLSMDPSRHQCTWKGQPINLTVTEFLLLIALTKYPGHVKSRDQLIDLAYGENIYVDDRTIDSHIKRLRKKFRSFDPDFSNIETLYGIGYRYNDLHTE